jgi:hypothetical protein
VPDAVDLTEVYRAARARVLETCQRRAVRLTLGGAVLLDRRLVHGIAPWSEDVAGGQGGPRVVAYFRPQLADPRDWLL